MDLPRRPNTLELPGADTRVAMVDAWRDALVAHGEGTAEEQLARAALLGHDAGHGVRTRFAARVVVLDGDARLLAFSYSRGRILLPGGGVDPGETFAEAAVREVREETTRAATLVSGLPAFVLVHAILPDDDGAPRVQYALIFRAEIDEGELDTDYRPVLWLDAASRAALAPTYPMLAAVDAALAGMGDAVPIVVLP